MATLNSRITHETVDGAINQKEVEAMKVQGVPSVFADGKLINVGRSDLGELLSKLEANTELMKGGVDNSVEKPVKNYDVLIVEVDLPVLRSAIYSARKGLNVAVIAERIGGQVKETVGIENLIPFLRLLESSWRTTF